jgi:hypothetical protein
VLIFAAVNLLVVNGANSHRLPNLMEMGLTGLPISELAAISIVTVLGSGPWFARWIGAMFAEGALLLAFVASLALGNERFSFSWSTDLAPMLAFVPLVSVSAKLPLLPMRYFGARRLCRREDVQDACSPTRQFGIADLFGMLTLAAATIGLAQWANEGRADLLLRMSVAPLLVGLLIALPCALGGLAADDKMRAGALTFAFTFVAIIPLAVLTGAPAQCFYLGSSSVGLTLLWLYLVRRLGYDLRRAGAVNGEQQPAIGSDPEGAGRGHGR